MPRYIDWQWFGLWTINIEYLCLSMDNAAFQIPKFPAAHPISRNATFNNWQLAIRYMSVTARKKKKKKGKNKKTIENLVT